MVEEAWPGDIVGLFDPGTLRIGDTLFVGEPVEYQGIPRFAPEYFARVKLKDPLTSLAFGQKYIQRLLEDSSVKGDLFMMAAAYNAGPGNLAKWKKSIRGSEDPLLFIESLPSRETRNFVERVMGAYWVYQARLGQPARSLEAVANGAWPTYQRSGNIAAAAN